MIPRDRELTARAGDGVLNSFFCFYQIHSRSIGLRTERYSQAKASRSHYYTVSLGNGSFIL